MTAPNRAPPAQNTFGVGKPLPYYCPACEAVPRAGYCNLAGCPTAPAKPGAAENPSETSDLDRLRDRLMGDVARLEANAEYAVDFGSPRGPNPEPPRWNRQFASDLRQALAALSSLQARITELEGERERERKLWNNAEARLIDEKWAKRHYAGRAEAAESRAERAEADAASWKANAAEEFLARQEAVEVLGPFAEVASWYADQEADTFEIWRDYPHGGAPRNLAQLANYRKAASLLQRLKSPSLEGPPE